jgi:hypothetical protein
MKKIIYLCFFAILTSCTAVSKNMPSDSTSVTIAHGTAATISDVQQEANRYCLQYGKRAYFRARYNDSNATFDCRYSNNQTEPTANNYSNSQQQQNTNEKQQSPFKWDTPISTPLNTTTCQQQTGHIYKCTHP